MAALVTIVGVLFLCFGGLVLGHAPSDIQLGIAASAFGVGFILLVQAAIIRKLNQIAKP